MSSFRRAALVSPTRHHHPVFSSQINGLAHNPRLATDGTLFAWFMNGTIEQPLNVYAYQ